MLISFILNITKDAWKLNIQASFFNLTWFLSGIHQVVLFSHLEQIAILIPGREADRTGGHIIQVSDSPMLLIEITSRNCQYDTMKFAPSLGTICRYIIQKDSTHSLVSLHCTNKLKVKHRCYITK